MSVKLAERVKEADWKTEKHVPVIDCPDRVRAGELFTVKASVGKEVAHPNTTEHHIRWITLYFHPEGEQFTCQVCHHEFNAHGESVQGANQGPVYTHHESVISLKVNKPGTLYAMSYCNIHGLWQSTKDIKVI